MRLNAQASQSVHSALESHVLKNVYRGFYDIPNELPVRKPDDLMSTVVGTSEALRRAESLHTRIGMHPSLIFFDQELYEN